MDFALVSVISIFAGFGVILIVFLFNVRKKENAGAAVEEEERARPAPQRRPEGMPRNAVRRRPTRGVRDRIQAAARQDDSDEEMNYLEEEEEDTGPMYDDSGKKIGAKKQKKLEEKEAKRQARESDLREREDRKQREAEREAERRKREKRAEAEEAAQLAEEERLKEEAAQKELEEYLAMKEAFVVEESGTQEMENDEDKESLLQDFINHIQDTKVIMLEDLASHFNLKTKDTIDRVKSLLEEGRLTGVLDDRGKFIYITMEEYDAVARFIRQRGRVSISDLAESSNQLINLTALEDKLMESVNEIDTQA